MHHVREPSLGLWSPGLDGEIGDLSGTQAGLPVMLEEHGRAAWQRLLDCLRPAVGEVNGLPFQRI